ncbi:chemotaxis protein CheW [Cellulosilyticum lentocellum]|uniref:CheW protein n=1 Tax=Cellulosilyticum lentocellum (strain ATCC 49066 / DSM 5427 / NCIMB 11756 / RHM5) TaxID=642492 RepID=F2JGP8_CELLD|nr:chemotaxis protein CheW [Cellulosilyticum lentocellum]ADZ84140.1 CheW protein [Cellulosilyticum lentocellum DSM 5427]
MEHISETIQQFIVFKLDMQLFGIDIQNVQIIEKMKSIMRVPKVPACVKGVMNLRGEIIPVISLREQFELEHLDYTDKTRIVIVKLEDAMVGIIVDEVKEVIEIANDQIEAVQNIQGKMKTSHILGVGKVEENIVTLLNLSNIIEEAFENEELR